MKTQPKTAVKFLVNEKEDNDLFAFFPKEIESKQNHVQTGEEVIFYDSYSHIGQHSGCHIDYVNESRPATKEEREPLIKELESIGYRLNILN